MIQVINKKSCNKILFFCPISPPITGQSMVSEIIYKMIQPRYLINTNTINKYFDTLVIIVKCFWLMLFYKIDVVYFTCTRSKAGAIKDIVLLVFCKIRKIKVINHLHGNDMMDLFTGNLMSKILLWSYNQIDTTIFVTEKQKNFMPVSLKKMKRVTVPNCYDSIFENIERDFSKAKKEVGILFVANLMKTKGIFVALDVFELIAYEYKNVIFHIAGMPMSDYLMCQSEVKILFDKKFHQLNNKFPGRFIYHGIVEGDLKKNLFIDNDIFLFPTFHKSEASPLVNIEAMRSGNVVITTNHNFLPDIVSEKEGRLVEPNDLRNTYAAVKYFLDHSNIMIDIQKHNIEHAKKVYSPDQFRKEITKVFYPDISEIGKTKSRNNTLFFCPIPPPTSGQAMVSEMVYTNYKPKYLIDTNIKKKFLGTVRILFETIYLLSFKRIDLVYFTSTRSKSGAIKDIVLLSLCKFKNIRVINHLHGNEIIQLFSGGMYEKIIIWAYAGIDTTIFVQEKQKQLLPDFFPEMKRVFISNYYDPALENIEIRNKNSNNIDLLYISFLMNSKGIFHALDAFEKLADEYPHIRLHIAGEFHADSNMTLRETKITFFKKFDALSNKFGDRIKYYGLVKNNEKRELFEKCDILLFPTFYAAEASPLVSIEAMRAGLAIISTNHNFISSIISKEEGILVEPNSLLGLTTGIRSLLDDKVKMKSMQQHNVEHAKKLYSPKIFVGKMMDLLYSN